MAAPEMVAIDSALEALETEWGIAKPLGAVPGGTYARYRQVLDQLQRRLCPKAKEIRQALQSPGMDPAAVMADTVLALVTKVPVPGATIAAKLTVVGIDNFCRDPAVLVK